jgi:ABC-type transporter Mla MlaB component
VRAGADAIVVVVRDDVEVARWQLTPAGRVDLALVEQLARWQLCARRRGCSLEVRGASPALVELVDLCGLDLPFS